MRVWIDVMGGEEWVDVMLPAIKRVSKNHPDVEFVVFWNVRVIYDILSSCENVEVIPTENDITDDVKFDSERGLLKWVIRSKESAIVQWVKSLREWKLDVMVSRGNTWAYLWYAKNVLKQEWTFAALSCWLPRVDIDDIRFIPKDVLMMDVWAEVDTTTDKLINNTHLGIEYLRRTKWIIEPKFTLLNIWTELYKGDKAYRDAHKEFVENNFGWKFIWNQESDTLLTEIAPDLIISGWMVWNIALKWLEGTFRATTELIKRRAFETFPQKVLWAYTWYQIKKWLWRFDPNNRSDWKMHGIDNWEWWEIIKVHWWANVKGVVNAISRTIENRKQKPQD